MIPSVKITELDLQLVKDYLRIDHDDDDILLSTMLSSAKSFIQNYIKMKFSQIIEEDGEIPDEFTVACLAIIAHWYERREIQGDKDTRGELSYVFSGLLNLHTCWDWK